MAGLQPWRGNLRVAQRSYSGLIIWLLPVGLALGLCACSRTPDPEVAVPPAVETLAPADAAAEPVAEDVAPVVAETSEPLADRVPETAATASDEASDALESEMLPAQEPADPDAEPFPAPESSEAIEQPQAEEPGVVETAEEAAAEMDEKSDEMAEAPVTLRAEEWADAADPTVLEPLETVAENLAEPETDAVVSAEPGAEIVSSEPVPPQTNAAALVNPEVVVPAGQTVFVAMEAIFRQISLKLNYLELLDAETIEKIKQTPATFGTDKPTKWDDALREILKPQNLDFIEEGEIVRVGPKAAIDQRHSVYAQEQLAANHAAIDVNFSEGIPLYAALRHIQSEAKLNVNFDWMAPEDRGIFKPAIELKADEVAAAPPSAKITTYATPPGKPVKWRTVLNNVLEPHGYSFVEVDGVVRILMQAQADQWKKSQIDAQPVVTRFVRIYHASPKLLAEQLNAVPGLKKHTGAFITPSKTDNSKDAHSIRYKGSGLSASSAGGGETVGGDVGDSGSYGSMERYRTPPGLMIGDVETNLDRIEEEVRKLDVRERQIVIEAKIFTVGANSMRNLGVDWGEQGLHGSAGFRSNLGREEAYERSRNSSRTRESTNLLNERLTAYQFSRNERGDRRNRPSDDELYDTLREEILSNDASSSGGTNGINPDSMFSTRINTWQELNKLERDSASIRNRDGQGSSSDQDWLSSTLDQTVDTFERVRSMSTTAGYSAILNPLEFDLIWQAVQNVSDFKMVSQPMIVIGDHSEALIRVGEIEPSFTKEWGEADENGYRPYSYRWQMVQTGVSLWVVPEISADGRMVRLSIHPQTSDALGRVIAGDNEGSYPALSIREVDTRVSVPSGSTLMMGGLINSAGQKIQRKIPFLGSIPFIGRLFRWDADSREGNNLIILLTPRILDDENPDSGYEKPAQPYVDDLMRGVGRNLGDPLPDFEGKVKAKTPPLPKEDADDLLEGLDRNLALPMPEEAPKAQGEKSK